MPKMQQQLMLLTALLAFTHCTMLESAKEKEDTEAKVSSSSALSSSTLLSSAQSSSSQTIVSSSGPQLSSSGLSSSISSSSESNLLVDPRDQQIYKTVRIGTQVWMAQNLNFGTFNKTPASLQAKGEKYCYNHTASECLLGGGMYQWQVAMDLPAVCQSNTCADQIQPEHQGICPVGWHVPSRKDFQTLIAYLGGTIAGTKLKLANTEFADWNSKNNDGNSSGFSAYPNGLMLNNGTFMYHGVSPHFWTTAEYQTKNAYRYGLNAETTVFVEAENHGKNDAMSVRCVQNTAK